MNVTCEYDWRGSSSILLGLASASFALKSECQTIWYCFAVCRVSYKCGSCFRLYICQGPQMDRRDNRKEHKVNDHNANYINVQRGHKQQSKCAVIIC